ncbi:MAG: molecular chaperone HtpG [Lachnospiraceae bacterium]|nr:molecular chaperone HtpG [Lachnospiraceae bacterium]
MTEQRGNLSIDSENIFPIIKKWLYSDHDIFVRELISNGCDAVTKLKKLDVIGETELPEGYKAKITVTISPEDRTIEFADNGIGMTEDEVKEYINQIAFSGAADFIEKYKDKAGDEQIIGHFGLGFYSAFMVADRVTIDTLSYADGAKAVYWESDGGMEYSMKDGERTEFGTTITLYLNEDTAEFSNEYRVREIIEKYCSFMPVEIYLEKKYEEKKDIDKGADEDDKANEPQSLSDTTPLWTKHPNDVTEEEYKEFYRKVFRDYKEPLFWIHLNMDYPFNLKGILYFPKVNTEYDNLEGVIKLYNNQVFIADNIKEVIPEFLMLLKGVIDCPDLPLNVSRSALQNDGFVKKISDYITKKVADKLSGMYKVDKENYEKFWDDISPFVKYGCLKDDKFREKIKDYVIFKNLKDEYVTLPEYIQNVYPDDETAEVVEDADVSDSISEESEKPKKNVYYVTDMVLQSQYINMFKEQGLDALVLTHSIDQPFIQQLEMNGDDIAFLRIDAGVNDEFTEKTEGEEWDKLTSELTEIFKKALDNDKLSVEVKKLKNENVASMITLSEETRRMQDMMKMYAMGGMAGLDDLGGGETLVLNANNNLVKYILDNGEGDKTDMFCKQLYDLAMLSHKPLAPAAMTEFVARSNEIMMLLAK